MRNDADHGRSGWGWTLGLGLLLVAVAVWALPRHIQPGDAGEFATVMLRGGVPHPSGYPWMRMLGVLAAPLHASGLPPATAAALPCAAAGVAGWLVLHRVALGLTRAGGTSVSGPVATFAIAMCALAPPAVLHMHDSEVWGPLVLASAAVVYVAVRRTPPLVLGLCFGLAVSHHLTAALLLPLVVSAAWPTDATLRTLIRTAAVGVAGGLVGLLPYATLMLGEGDAWRWGDLDSLGGFVHHVTRSDYGVLQLSLHTESPPALQQLARVGESLGGALSAGLVRFPWIGGVLVVSVWAVAIRMTRSDHTRVIRGLVAAALLSGGVFPLLHNIDPHSPFGAWILERFDILTLALTAPVLAVTLAHLCGRLSGPSRVRFGLALCAALLVVRQLLMTAWNGVPSDSDEVEQYAIDLLHTPEPDRQAIVFGTDDHRVFPVLFAREVLGEGSHVLYIDASMLAYPWYRAHLRRQFPHLPDVDKPLRLMDALWRDPQLHDTPIYLANVFSRPSSKLPRVPEGILWRVLPPHALAIGAQEVLARHRAALGRYGPRSPGEEPLPGHPFAGDLAQAYTEGSTMLAEALRAEGDTAP